MVVALVAAVVAVDDLVVVVALEPLPRTPLPPPSPPPLPTPPPPFPSKRQSDKSLPEEFLDIVVVWDTS